MISFQSKRQKSRKRGMLAFFLGMVKSSCCGGLKTNSRLHATLQPRHPRRPRGSQSSREKRRDKSFQAQAEELLGTDSHRTISKRSSECWPLIGHKKCFVLLCPISEQFLVSSFSEFVHDGYYVATAQAAQT